jgi:SAM-dependent methyltransferase
VVNELMARLFPGEPPPLRSYHGEIRARLPAAGRVLDLGCGDHAQLAPYRTPAREVWGADFQAHPDLADPDWFRVLGPGGAIPFPAASFDLVAATWVLEHVAAPRRFLREVARVLRPGGHFVAHTINGNHYVTWLRRLLGLAPHSVSQALVRRLYGRESHDTFPTHYRLNTVPQLRSACRGTGLALVGLRRYANLGYFRFSRALLTAAGHADRFLEKVAPGYGRIYLTVTLRKGEGVLARAAA